MRQEIGDLVEDIVAQFRVFDPDMDVHAADQQPVRQILHILRQNVVAVLIRMALVDPFRKGVRRGRYRPQPMSLRRRGDAGPQIHDPLARLRYGTADRRPDFDLRAQKLRSDHPAIFADQALAIL